MPLNQCATAKPGGSVALQSAWFVAAVSEIRSFGSNFARSVMFNHQPMKTLASLLLLLTIASFAAAADSVALTLHLPATPATNGMQTAVELISDVMATNGFRSVNTSVHSNQNIIAGFVGQGRLGCFVYHRSNELQVVMKEMGRFRSRPAAIKARDDLQRRLSERFGKNKVSQ